MSGRFLGHSAAAIVADMDRPTADSLLEDYKLKTSFATDVLNRYQTQGQVLLSLEVAVATVMIISSTGALSTSAKWIALLHVGLSAVWTAIGVVGRRRVTFARKLQLEAGQSWAAAAKLRQPYTPANDGTEVVRVGVVAPIVLVVFWAALAAVLWLL